MKKKHRNNTKKPKRPVSKAAVRRAVEGKIVQDRIRILVENGQWNMEGFDAAIVGGLSALGITRRRANLSPFEKQLKKHLGLTRTALEDLPNTNTDMPVCSPTVLREWAESSEDLEIIHEDFYKCMNLETPKYCIIEGKQSPKFTGFMCRFRSKPLYVNIRSYSSRPCDWTVDAYGEESGIFMAELQSRADDWLREQYRGCFLSHDLRKIVVKTWQRDQLIYPPELSGKVDELVTCFKNWYASDVVKRWGYVLIGPTGSGKTSIGGLIAGIKPDDVTFLYAPAGELRTSGDVRNLFRCAQLFEPAVLQIDDIDMVTKDRQKEDAQSITNAFMDELDGLNEATRLFTIFTTNDPSKMETAIINRAGRISNKLIVKDYGLCLGALLIRFAKEYGLNIEPGALVAVGTELGGKLKSITPDEVKNACQRLHLIHGEKRIVAETLMRAVAETFDAFHNEDHQKSHLKRPKNGHAKDNGREIAEQGRVS